MKAVFLDFETMGGGSLDPTPLFDVLPELEIFDTTPQTGIGARIRDAEVVLTNKARLDASNLADAARLRLIGLTATGTDNVDLALAAEKGIAVCNIRAYCTQSVVEHVFATLLTLTHSLHRFTRDVRRGAWQRADVACMLAHPIRELSGMTLGIVGLGTLGRAVRRAAEAFGMDVVIARRRGAAPVAGDGRVGFDEMLAAADVVTLHCPLDDSTGNLIGADELARMKPDAILINTARGGLVDSQALADALSAGRIGAAAIDVLPQEPPVDGDPLLDYAGDNLILTPHIAWGTLEARQTAIRELALNVAAFIDGRRRNRVV